MVGKIIVDIIEVVAAGDTFVVEEKIFAETGVVRVPARVGFIEWVGAKTIPIQFSVGFLHALAIAIVNITDARGGDQLVLRVVNVGGGRAGRRGLSEQVSGSVITVAADLVGSSCGKI